MNSTLTKKIVLSGLFWIIGVVLHSQQIPRTRIFDLATGYSQLMMLDQQVSPLIYKAKMVPLTMGYTVMGDHLFEFGFDLKMGVNGAKRFKERKVIWSHPDTDGVLQDETFDLQNLPILQQHLSVSYLCRLPVSTENLTLFAGASVTELFSVSFVPTAVFFINDLTLNPAIAGFYELKNENRLSMKLTLPLAGFMVRLPYSNDPVDGKHGHFGALYATNIKFATPADYQRLNLDVAYYRPFNGKWNMGIHYLFYWLHYQPNRGVTAYNNEIRIQFSKRLKDK